MCGVNPVYFGKPYFFFILMQVGGILLSLPYRIVITLQYYQKNIFQDLTLHIIIVGGWVNSDLGIFLGQNPNFELKEKNK